MELEEKDIELIDAFYQGTLDPVNAEAFNKRRETDPDFDQKVTDYTRIMKEIKAFGEAEFIDKIKSWEADIVTGKETTKEAKVISLRQVWSIAAAIVLIALPLGYILYNSFAVKQDLYVAYFEPYEDMISSRANEVNLLDKAMESYNQGLYTEAILTFRRFLETNPDHEGAHTYLAISYLANDDAKAAIDILERHYISDTGLYRELTDWYLALAYLRIEQKAKATAILKKIQADHSHIYNMKAISLLDDLD